MIIPFSASGSILVEITDQTGDDALFGISGVLENRIQYTTDLYQNNDNDRRWIIEEEIGAGKELEVHEKVILMNIPAPGQTGDSINNPMFSPYVKMIRANLWISASGSWQFSMPIPHSASGMSDPRLNGQWTMWFDNNGFHIHASADAYDFTNPNDSYQCYGVIEYVNF